MFDLLDDDQPIKALSIWQPYASLIAAGVRRHDTRYWSTPYRGLVAIHAAKTIDFAGAPEELCEAALGRNWQRLIPIGMVLAIGRLTACGPAERVRDFQLADHASNSFTRGRYAFRFEDIRRLEAPIPLPGRQGLFNWTPPVNLRQTLHPVVDHAQACRYIGWGSATSFAQAAE